MTVKINVNDLLHEQYANKVAKLHPEDNYCQTKVPFKGEKTVQRGYILPVRVSRNHGVHRWANRVGGGTAAEGQTNKFERAVVNAPNFLFPWQIDLQEMEEMENASKDKASAKLADLLDYWVADARRELELEMLLGGWRGTIAHASVAAGSGDQTDIQLTKGSFIPGLWFGAENTPLEIRLSSDNATVLQNGGTTHKYTLKAVDMDTATLTVQASTTQGATDLEAISADHDLFAFGAYGNAVQTPLRTQIANTGTMFGINAATWSVWAGNTFALPGTRFTLSELNKRVMARLAPKVTGRTVIDILVSDLTFSEFNEDAAAALVVNAEAKAEEFANGYTKISFRSSRITAYLRPHLYVPNGEAYVIPRNKCTRVGATDLSMQSHTSGQNDYLVRPKNGTVYGGSMYTNQQIFLEAPSHAALVTWTPTGDAYPGA